MNAETITATMRREGIRNINMAPEWQGSGFTVSLNCGGMPGYGLSFEDALAEALARNVDWLNTRVTA